MRKVEPMSMQECFQALNILQENVEKVVADNSDLTHPSQLECKMKNWLSRVGTTVDDINTLKVIHISGTKGKGSTSAFCESILRHNGLKTGFYSSPHLVEVRERFRINGQPISREQFVSYFWSVYNMLEKSKAENDDSMPGFDGFFTIMAFYLFLKEKIDVAVIEVGIGGKYDCTNVIGKPVVCGVTSLGLDHVHILGNAIEKIAWHKAGIFKPDVPAFTVIQPPEALKVLRDRAVEIGCCLQFAPDFNSYETEGKDISLGISGDVQKLNSSLALQLTRTWLQRKDSDYVIEKDCEKNDVQSELKVAPGFPLTSTDINGLENCTWVGRAQTIKKDKLTYYLDGAHTLESIQQCVLWFLEKSRKEEESISGKVVKVLLLNITDDRDVEKLIEPLMACNFDAVAFCPNRTYESLSVKEVQLCTNTSDTDENVSKKSLQCMEIWTTMISSEKSGHENVNEIDSQGCSYQNSTKSRGDGYNHVKSWHVDDSRGPTHGLTDRPCRSNMSNGTISSTSMAQHSLVNNNQLIIYHPCVYEALIWVSRGRNSYLKVSRDHSQMQSTDHIQLLVTGSVRLVGEVLRFIRDENNI